MLNIKWFIGSDDLTDVHKIREEVFIKEQGVPHDLEIDGTDKYAQSLLLLDDDKPFATGRIILIHEEYTLGRICVLKEYRNKGYGNILVNELIKRAKELGAKSVHIHAQLSVVPFYEKLGFIKEGNEFKEAGIRHINMKKDV